tara:strand:- start:44 stop:1027 length:984 start_codon:yes stop_codon:yes gene_type:complete
MNQNNHPTTIDENRYSEFLNCIGIAETMPVGITESELDLEHKQWEQHSGWNLKRVPSCWSRLIQYLMRERGFSDDEWRECVGFARNRNDILELNARTYLRKRSKRNRSKFRKLDCLTREILENSIIIDFEGLKDQIPALAGVLIDQEFEQYCFEERLLHAANEKGIEQKEISVYLEVLLDKAIREERTIIGYSIREYEVFCQILPDRIEDISEVYLNAIATKWFRKRYPIEIEKLEIKGLKFSWKPNRRIGLKELLTLEPVSYPYPSWMKGVGPAKAIKRMSQQLERHGSYELASKGAKRAWTMMIEYNAIDVRGLYFLLDWILYNE